MYNFFGNIEGWTTLYFYKSVFWKQLIQDPGGITAVDIQFQGNIVGIAVLKIEALILDFFFCYFFD